MAKKLDQVLHYINQSLMERTNLSPETASGVYSNQNPLSIIRSPNQNLQSSLVSKINNPGLETLNSNYVLCSKNFLSETQRKSGGYIEQLQNLSGPFSLDQYQLRTTKKMNRIVIPSVISNMEKLRRSDSSQSQIPDFRKVTKFNEKVMMAKNYSCNSKSTTSSSVRQRLKDINWPRSIRPAQNLNSTYFF